MNIDFKNKKLIISVLSFIFICLSFYLIKIFCFTDDKKKIKNTNLKENLLNQPNQHEDNKSVNKEENKNKKDIIIKKIFIETEYDFNSEEGRKDIADKISQYIKNKIGNQCFSSASWLLSNCRPSYNSQPKYHIDLTDSSKKYFASCGLDFPIKSPSEDLLAVFFDGGEGKIMSKEGRRGGDEITDEEGDEIPKYTLEDLKQIDKKVDCIYIFEKRKKPITTIKVGSYDEMMSKIKEINPSVALYNASDVEESEEVKEKIKEEYENNRKPGFNEFENNQYNYKAGSQRTNFIPLLNVKLKNVNPNVMGVYICGDASGALQACIGYNSDMVDITDVLRLTDKEYAIYIFEQE